MLLLIRSAAYAEVSAESLASISTPDTVEKSIGTLKFKDGAPSADTLKGVSVQAALGGLQNAGIKDNEMLIFSELMNSEPLFLTANADTVYYLGFIDLSKGPMVLETPLGALGTIDHMWFRWVIDFGRPGPDRGEGGKYLLVGPD